jgi:hypothetical protein
MPFFSVLSDISARADQFAKHSLEGNTVSIKGMLA